MPNERELADLWFPRLVELLAVHKLPAENGPARFVPVDEFMFMGVQDGGGVALFKHGFTRNYVKVFSKDGAFHLYVPHDTSAAFHKGYFDPYPELPEV